MQWKLIFFQTSWMYIPLDVSVADKANINSILLGLMQVTDITVQDLRPWCLYMRTSKGCG